MADSQSSGFVRSVPALVALAAVLAGAFASIGHARQDQIFAVRVDAAAQKNVEETRRVTGDLRAVARSNVATREPGLIVEIPVDEGDRVKAGDVLARLDDARLHLDLARFQAEHNVATSLMDERESTVTLRQSDLDAILALRDRGASNPKELADAQSELSIAKARRDGAKLGLTVIEAQIDLLKRRIADMTITAPFDGIVISQPMEVGEWAGEGDAVIELLSAGRYDAWLNVQEQYKPALADETIELAVQIPSIDREFPPLPARVLPQVDPTGRNFQVIVRLEDAENILAAGMAVNAWIPTGRSGEHLVVGEDALLENATGYFVYVARPGSDGGHAAYPASVEVIFDAGEELAVRSNDLRPGDLVVVEGNERLFPTAPVQVVNAAGLAGSED